MSKPSFSDWPQESIDKLTAIIRNIVKEELHGGQAVSESANIIATQGVDAFKALCAQRLKEDK